MPGRNIRNKADHTAPKRSSREPFPAASGTQQAERYAGYIRWSSTEQGRGYSKEAQIRAITQYVEQRGGVIYRLYVEEARTGRTLAKRVELAQAIDDASAGEYDTLVVHKLDRLARNVKDAMHVLSELEDKYKVQVRSVLDNVELDSPYAPAVRTLLLSIAEGYSRNLSEEVTKGQREMIEAGRFIGKRPFGYVTTNPGTRESTIKPAPWSSLVPDMFRLYAEGSSMKQIASIVNARLKEFADEIANSGTPPLFVTKSTLGYLLRNRTYLGELRYNDMTRFDPDLALVDEELFGDVQRRLTLNRLSRSARPARSGTQYRSLLAGLIYCSRCHTKMCGQNDSRNSGSGEKVYHYYRDYDRSGTGGCSQTLMIQRAIVDANVVERVHAIQCMLPGDAPAKLRSRLHATDRQQSARQTVTQLEEKRKRLATIYSNLLISDDEYHEKDAALARQVGKARVCLDLSTERALGKLLETITTFPCECEIPCSDVEAMTRLNGELRSMITAIYVDYASAAGKDLTTDVEWSDQVRQLCQLLDVHLDQPPVKPSEAAIEGTVAPSPAGDD